MTILVTGGAGYIGSHTVRLIQRSGYNVVVLDNLVYGHRSVVEGTLKAPLVEGQVGDRALLDELLSGRHPSLDGHQIQAVIHFAAYAYVGESVTKPMLYYRNNVGDSLVLLEALKAEGDRRGSTPIPLVFSSTCATYGVIEAHQCPITELFAQKPINPYGRSKLMVEQMISDFGEAYGLPSVIFRYFNAAGADPSGDLGEKHSPETHLIPLILSSISGHKPYLQIFGNDYPTPDGTCIRDYVHVNDLAEAHLLGLQKILTDGKQYIFNLGSGTGASVLEVIKIAKTITGGDLSIHISARRVGDPPVLVSSFEKARLELGWNPSYSDLETIIRHAWKWHERIHF